MMGIVPWCPKIIENDLSTTSTRSSSSSALSMPLISFMHSPSAPIQRLSFFLHSVRRRPLHHQFIAIVVAFIMAHRFVEIAKQLFWHLHKLLMQMTIICYMFFSHLTNSSPQRRSYTWSCWSFLPQGNQSPPCDIICEDMAVIFIMPLALTLEAQNFLAQLQSSLFFVFQALQFQVEVLQL